MITSRFIPGKNEFRKTLFLIMVLAIAARLFVLFQEHPMKLRYDEFDYYELAENLYEGKGFVAQQNIQVQFQGGKPGEPTAYRTVVLPAFLAGHFFIFGKNTLPPRISLVLLSSLCCIFIGLTGRLLFSPKVGKISALIWALYPPCLLSGFTVDRFHTEAMGCFFIVVSFYYIVKLFRNYSLKNAAIGGLFFGMAILTRGYFAIILPLIVGYLFFFATEKKFKSAFFFGLFASVILVSWMARNYFEMGKPVLSTQTDSFYWGNNGFSRGSVHGDVFQMPPWTAPQVLPLVAKYPGIREYSELRLSEVWTKEAFQYAREHPKRTLWLWYKKTAAYILPFQMWRAGFYKYHYVYFILLLGGIAGFWMTRNKKEFFLLLLPFIGVWIATLLTIIMDRYRYTIEPFIIIAGVYGITELVKRFRNKANGTNETANSTL